MALVAKGGQVTERSGGHGGTDSAFPASVADLPAATQPGVEEVAPGESFDLTIHPVAKRIGDGTFRMLSYNGSIPGPTLRVRQGSEIFVNVRNETEMETTVHWHGLRLENRYDGVPHDTQAPIPPGGNYTHRLTFPDAGLFWYHPHMREDYAQEMGLYGNLIVDPAESDYWPPVDREFVMTLDDILIEEGAIAPFDPHHATFAAMGRFGNVLLVGGETFQQFDLRKGEVARLYLTNTANTRVFKVALPGVRMKLVGSDGGRYEREQWVQDVVIAPSERTLVDVLCDESGTFTLQHVTPDRTYDLASLVVSDAPTDSSSSVSFDALRVNQDMAAAHDMAKRYLDASPDKTLALIAEMDLVEPNSGETVVYICPMHADVMSDEGGNCPKCGMKLMPSTTASGDTGSHGSHDHSEAMSDGIEWEDTMVDINRQTTSATIRWKVVDRGTGRENMDIDWVFTQGDQVKIRLVNEMESDHPMHHPFHIHGERFLVLARNDIPEENAVWKDTVLLRTGEVVDILMDASNPGLWMAHCHIAEHMESGMMFNFRVTAAG